MGKRKSLYRPEAVVGPSFSSFLFGGEKEELLLFAIYLKYVLFLLTNIINRLMTVISAFPKSAHK